MTYTVVKGDTLGTIAAKLLGAASRYTEIVKANPQITNPNLIQVGQVINIPTTTTAAAQSPVVTKTLAPVIISGPKLTLAPAPAAPQIISALPTTYQAGYSDQILSLLQNKNVLMILGAGALVAITLLARRRLA